MKYKLRFYKLKGYDKGNLDHEELFNTKEEMYERYDEVFDYKLYALNPTGWENVNGKWDRIEGF